MFTSQLSLSDLGFTWLNMADVSVSSECHCNSRFNSIQISLLLGQFQCDFYSTNTRFTLTKERLALNKERFTHTKSL